jgi:hypothetical protein
MTSKPALSEPKDTENGFVSGHDFSRAKKAVKQRALAPVGRLPDSIWIFNKFLEAVLHHFKLDRPVGAVLFARSQARHRYQLATERNGAQRRPLLSSTSGLGKSSAARGRVFGTR